MVHKHDFKVFVGKVNQTLHLDNLSYFIAETTLVHKVEAPRCIKFVKHLINSKLSKNFFTLFSLFLSGLAVSPLSIFKVIEHFRDALFTHFDAHDLHDLSQMH